MIVIYAVDYIIKIIKVPITFHKKVKRVLKDIKSTLYDEDGSMSQPRLMVFSIFCCIIAAWVSEQFLKFSFEHFSDLINAFGIAMGGYVSKKISGAIKGRKGGIKNAEPDSKGESPDSENLG